LFSKHLLPRPNRWALNQLNVGDEVLLRIVGLLDYVDHVEFREHPMPCVGFGALSKTPRYYATFLAVDAGIPVWVVPVFTAAERLIRNGTAGEVKACLSILDGE